MRFEDVKLQHEGVCTGQINLVLLGNKEVNMDNNQPVGSVSGQPGRPLLRVNVGSCEVTYIKSEEKRAVINEAKELLVRYGRLDRTGLIKSFEEAVRAQGKGVEDLPLVTLTTITEQADAQACEYSNGGKAVRVEVDMGGNRMQLKPEVVMYEGLDASKEVSEANPRKYLVMPFQARMGDPSGGILIPDQAFEQWIKGVPRQLKPSEVAS